MAHEALLAQPDRRTRTAGPAGPAGAAGAAGPQGPPGTPAPTLQNLSGAFAGTNATVATSLDGVQFGPYPSGGLWGGSVLYTGANGLTARRLSASCRS